MGCGASKDQKIGVADSIKTRSDYNYNSSNSKGKYNNGFKQVDLRNPHQSTPPAEIKPPTAFIISFDENKTGNTHRPPPGRLRLDPIKPNPKLTQKKLDEKMRSVEMKREKILAERVKSSNGKKRRRQMQQQANSHHSAGSSDSGFHNRERGDRGRDRDYEYEYESSSRKHQNQSYGREHGGSANARRYDDMDNYKENTRYNKPNYIDFSRDYHPRGNDSGIGVESPSSMMRDDEKRQRLLRQRRIITRYNDFDDSDIEHDKNYNRDSGNYF